MKACTKVLVSSVSAKILTDAANITKMIESCTTDLSDMCRHAKCGVKPKAKTSYSCISLNYVITWCNTAYVKLVAVWCLWERTQSYSRSALGPHGPSIGAGHQCNGALLRLLPYSLLGRRQDKTGCHAQWTSARWLFSTTPNSFARIDSKQPRAEAASYLVERHA